MAKNKPGIHLFKERSGVTEMGENTWHYFWHIVARNGRIIARSSETYSRKSVAVKSIKIAGQAFWDVTNPNWNFYYDHSKKDSPLQTYL
jgi:uncharacterized protein YegP (UPF0339 family)